MVRTRHSGDIDVVESPKFLSLDNEREMIKKSMMRKDKSGTNPISRGAYQEDDDYNIFEEDQVVESRLRPRTGPRRAYNYLDEDSSDDDQRRFHKRHENIELRGQYRSSRSVKEEMFDRREQRRERSSRALSAQVEDEDEVSCQIRRKSLRQVRQSVPSVDQIETRTRHKKNLSRQIMNVEDGNEVGEDTDNEDRKDEESEEDDQKEREDSDMEDGNNEFTDMYSRVKRKRLRVKREIFEDGRQNRNNNQVEDTDEDDENLSIRRSERNAKKKPSPPQIIKSYSLREHKPRTDLYKAPVEERKIRKNTNSIFEVTPTKKTGTQPYQSPAQRKTSKKRSAMHSSSSSTSISSGESSDEKSFKKRKAKSMAKARSRMRPMNFSTSDPATSVIKDRVKSGASLADVEPMNIDKNITFNSIGGLGRHIRALKEMVVFPLLYDKVFQRFNVDPPRGVLFYGPPGTGKTLVARALANECSQGDKRVAFFMRKGADCLSKWVGESERQLRLLFDQAYKYRPSIIFFDEIDGLAPVRSSRQDQIHSSIVSTLLALMDGLDSRGEIVVIGATNRIDSLDPALRRPGRFDREFLFPLPTLEARKQILKIQTSKWNPKLNDAFVSELAEKCVGYCGADLKALCTEAAMLALRRRYPQIYMSNEALQLDESSIHVCAKDFFNAINNIIPTSRRSVNAPGRPLSLQVFPLLSRQLNRALARLCETFPPCLTKMSSSTTPTNAEIMWEELGSDEDEETPSIFATPVCKNNKSQTRKSLEDSSTSKQFNMYMNFASFTSQPQTFRPRIMLTGSPGQGQTSYIAPAIIHKMEELPVHVLDLPALYAVTAKTPEESCANVFHEAKRKSPSIIYMPYINQWWGVLGDTLRITLLTLIQDLDPSTPLLLLATSEQPYSSLDSELQHLFSQKSGEVLKMANPNADERKSYFKDLLLQHSCKAPPEKNRIGHILKLLEQRNKDIKFLPNEFSIPCKLNKEKDSRNFADCRLYAKNKKLCRSVSSTVRSRVFREANLQTRNSVHSMTLRSSKAIRGCNNNHTADCSQTYNYCSMYCSDQLTYLTSRTVKLDSFGMLNRARNKFHKKVKNSTIGVKPKVKMFSRGRNTNYSNNHPHFSKRHQRYLNRLNKAYLIRSRTKRMNTRSCDSKLYQEQESYPCSSKHLSCGTVQMLYRKDRAVNSIQLCDLALPINLGHLKKKYSFSRKNFCNGIVKKLRCGRKLQMRYDLRSKSSQLSSDELIKIKSHQNIDNSDNTAKRMLEALPKAAPTAPKELTKQEMESLLEKEELTLMELRIFLRDVLHKLGGEKKFSIFTKAVNIEDAPDYYEVIENPMDLSTMMSKIDCHEYNTVRAFMDDIDLICCNALEYNPDRGPMDRVIRHRACALKDTAYAIIKTELDKDFEKICVDIEQSRKRRGIRSSTVPNFVRTKPTAQTGSASTSSRNVIPSYLDSSRPPRSIPEPEGQRFSKRVRGLNIEPTPALEDVEKTARNSNSTASPIKDSKNVTASDGNVSGSQDSENESKKNNSTEASTDSPSFTNLPVSKSPTSKSPASKSQTDPLHKKSRRQKCVWCKPTRKRRKLFQEHVLPALKKRMMLKAAAQEKQKAEKSSSQSVSLSQPLLINIQERSESEDLKSPVRKSTRLQSPPLSSSRITTRRQSLSPNLRGMSEVPAKDQSLSETPSDNLNGKAEPNTEQMEHNTTEEPSSVEETEKTKTAGDSTLLENTMESLQDIESNKKETVVKRLDLDFVAVDSGAGSSLDGNGDSRDSTDNKLEESSKMNTSPHLYTDFNQNNAQETTDKSSSVLKETQNKLVIPTERLSTLLDGLVVATEDYSVEVLEKIYSHLSQIIHRHRQFYDRSSMVDELEKKVEELTTKVSCSSSFRL